MENAYYMGIDIGSSSLKGVLADRQGNVCASGQLSYEIDQPFAGWAESHPEVWWNGVRQFLGQAMEACPPAREHLRGIFVSGMVPNLVALDADGQPVRPAILYRDNRAVRECDRLNQTVGLTFNMQDVLPKWVWIRDHEPQRFSRIRSILNTHSYIVYRLTGILSTDSDIAALMGESVFDPDRGWNRALLESLGLPVSVLPPAYHPGQVVGTIQAQLADQLGITADVPVFAGNGDSLASMLGTGVVHRGDAMIYLGTAATLWTMEEDLIRLAGGPIFGSGKLHFAGNTLTGGELLRWFRYGLQLDGENWSFDQLEEMARNIAPGADGLIILPHFMGERTPALRPQARGMICGLTPSHTGGHIYRALMEAVAYSLKDSYASSGCKADRLVVTGGGARSSLWRQILSDVFAADVEYYARGDAPLGNAYFAAVALGDVADFDGLSRWLGQRDICSPQPENVRTYEKRFGAYRQLDGMLAGFPAVEE